jgi:hypothetical protein
MDRLAELQRLATFRMREAATLVVTTLRRARVGLPFIAVSLRSSCSGEKSVVLGRIFLLASRFSPLAGVKLF